MRVSVVANPRAGSGAAARKLQALKRGLTDLGIAHEVLETERRGHASELARQARDGGATVLLVVGGDGTLNEVSQSYIDTDGQPIPGPAVGIVPAGTGGDFARGVQQTRADIPAVLARLSARKLQPLDLGVLTLTSASGAPLHRAFLNIASMGISGAVDERVERGPKWLGGKAAFLWGTIGATLGYQNVPLEISIDGEVWHRGPLFVAAIANGQFLGGGMHIAPRADTGDGQFDVVVVGDISKPKLAALFSTVYRGAHLDLDCVSSQRGRLVSVRALRDEKPVLVDVDGETPGYLPLTARIFPGALRLLVD
jgi:diacylglycerol kinase (ATP)